MRYCRASDFDLGERVYRRIYVFIIGEGLFQFWRGIYNRL
jgi:hypothetical protein